MSARFEEIDWCATAMGDLTLRRRRDAVTDTDIYDVKLGDDYLMSSLFTVAEIAVAQLAMAALAGSQFDVAVGGLGLGYTAQAVLDDARVRSLIVVDALEPVIGWHERGLVPVSVSAKSDPRCRLVHGDFFDLVRTRQLGPQGEFHAIVVDIDHSPRHLLDPSHADFYDEAGTARLAAQLHPGGVFSLWSNDPPDDEYVAMLNNIFAEAHAEVITFDNPLQGREATNTVYVATMSAS